MSGMLFLLFVQSLFQFEAKRGNERAIKERKIILTSPFPERVNVGRIVVLYRIEYFIFHGRFP